jgi:hypothetical protein
LGDSSHPGPRNLLLSSRMFLSPLRG